MGLAAGPALGAVLDRLLEAVIVDPALNKKETLLELAKR
jgi:poly(A) polymerase/tRNA nucleotidyltransferase (CCA-adding enzyme)